MSLIIGCHSSYKPGILAALINAVEKAGADAVQTFLGPSTSSSLKDKLVINPDECADIKSYVASHNIRYFIHSVYVMNLCKFPASSARIQYAHANIIHDLHFCEAVGAVGVIIHFGNQDNAGIATAIDNMASNISWILEATKSLSNSKIILETSAGQGKQIGITLEEISSVLQKIGSHRHRLGICIDTAHIFASGYDITTSSGWDAYMRKFNDIVGIHHLACFHLNDSASLLGDKKDRHLPLGSGNIFGIFHPNLALNNNRSASVILQHIRNFAISTKIPIILETRGGDDYEGYQREISSMRSGVFDDLLLVSSPPSRKNKTKKQPIMHKNFNNKITDPLRLMLDYYRVTKDAIRANAYQRAIYQLSRYPGLIKSSNDVKHLEGIGSKMLAKIDEILETGTLASLHNPDVLNILEILPSGDTHGDTHINEISKIYGFGEIIAKRLAKRNIKTQEELKAAIDNGEFTPNSQQVIGLKYVEDLEVPIPRDETEAIKSAIETYLFNSDGFKSFKVLLAGSYPSGKPASKDIDIILVGSRSQKYNDDTLQSIIDLLKTVGLITAVLSVGATKFLGLVKLRDYHRHLDIRLIPASSEVTAYFYYTSGAAFNKFIREKAKRRGFRLNEWGLYSIASGKEIPIASEADIFHYLGMDYIALEERRLL